MWINKKKKIDLENKVYQLEQDLFNCKNKVDCLERILKDNQLLEDVISDREKISKLINEFLSD